ncbi:AAA family ATPase [Shewanella algae]|uniref:AAA family ATPase n=1 Tax=Shewanella algae TaxID=38313 RepID=UPI0011849E9E|nr:AAA family ATPase [Shewanella algae]BCV42345.1 hypothetical protein TUM17378_36070 [Shewanella algae]
MDSIRVKGLRSLIDTGQVSIKPINVLVGTNSSGKSSFLRIFPLIRQSIERKTKGPILWNGHYVDFESLATSIHNGPINKLDVLSFCFNMSIPEELAYNPIAIHSENRDVEISLEIKLRPGNDINSCYTSNYIIGINGHELEFHFDEDGIIEKIFSSRLSWELKKHDLKFQKSNTDSLLPIFRNSPYFSLNLERQSKVITTLRNQIIDLISKFTGSKSENVPHNIFRRVSFNILSDKSKHSLLAGFRSTKKWEEFVKDDFEDTKYEFLFGLIDLYTILEHSSELNSRLSKSFQNVHYVAPLRASTERYYRYQDLSVSEIDHTGENLGMFLANIPEKEKISLNNWTWENFGFKIKDSPLSSHIAIELVYGESKHSDNIADMGFGFSQILPIIVQLWSVASGYEDRMKGLIKVKKNKTPVIFVIEQPELHLHPKMQASVALAFNIAIKLAIENDIDLRLIIETHSQSIISKFSDLIALEELKNTDINIIIFEQDRASRESTLSYAMFDEDGDIVNWPSGFFSY